MPGMGPSRDVVSKRRGSCPGRPSSPAARAGRRRWALLAVWCGLALSPTTGVIAKSEPAKDIVGWAEPVLVGESRLEMTAKLDTGAETSSLDATRIRRYRKSGTRWVQFTVSSRETGRRVVFRKRLVRRVRIKEHDGSRQERPVVQLEVCLGTHLKSIEVSLTDRSEFDYPMLIGRRALAGIAVVDPDLSLTSEPACYDEDWGE